MTGVTLIPEWGDANACENCSTMDKSIFMPDKTCSCGVEKHHYHCAVCGRIMQVG